MPYRCPVCSLPMNDIAAVQLGGSAYWDESFIATIGCNSCGTRAVRAVHENRRSSWDELVRENVFVADQQDAEMVEIAQAACESPYDRTCNCDAHCELMELAQERGWLELLGDSDEWDLVRSDARRRGVDPEMLVKRARIWEKHGFMDRYLSDTLPLPAWPIVEVLLGWAADGAGGLAEDVSVTCLRHHDGPYINVKLDLGDLTANVNLGESGEMTLEGAIDKGVSDKALRFVLTELAGRSLSIGYRLDPHGVLVAHCLAGWEGERDELDATVSWFIGRARSAGEDLASYLAGDDRWPGEVAEAGG